MWTGHRQGFALARFEEHDDLAADLSARVGKAASVTGQTAGWVSISLGRAGATALLEGVCPPDLWRMEAGMADRTGLGHIDCFVLCDVRGIAYRVLGPRSSALSLWQVLDTVAGGLA